jgi:hypothetical protein
MKGIKRGPKYLLFVAICATVATVLQIYGALRYIRRLPGDTLGVVLYITVAVLFGVVATANYCRWAWEKKSN